MCGNKIVIWLCDQQALQSQKMNYWENKKLEKIKLVISPMSGWSKFDCIFLKNLKPLAHSFEYCFDFKKLWFISRHLHPKIPTVLSLGWIELTQPKKSIRIQYSTQTRGYFWVPDLQWLIWILVCTLTVNGMEKSNKTDSNTILYSLNKHKKHFVSFLSIFCTPLDCMMCVMSIVRARISNL